MKPQMRSQKGITMISLILYVASFVAVTAVVAGITTFFYSNMQVMDTSVGTNSSYNRLNLYLINECKKSGAELFAYRGSTGNELTRLSNSSGATNRFVTFIDENGNKNSVIYDSVNKNLYYNSIKLCEKVENFDVTLDKSTGKDVLNILVNIDGTAFQTKYVVGS